MEVTSYRYCSMNGSLQSQVESGMRSPGPYAHVMARGSSGQHQQQLLLLPGTAGNNCRSRGRVGEGSGENQGNMGGAGEHQAASSVSSPDALLAFFLAYNKLGKLVKWWPGLLDLVSKHSKEAGRGTWLPG